jgi:hypothetical protein
MIKTVVKTRNYSKIFNKDNTFPKISALFFKRKRILSYANCK